MLTSAADDADQTPTFSIEDIRRRGRRSVRRYRTVTQASVAVAAVLVAAGLTGWSSTRAQEVQAAGPTEFTDDHVGTNIGAPPPVSPLQDGVVFQRCLPLDQEHQQSMKEMKSNKYDTAGPLDKRWKLVLKAGSGDEFTAVFLSPRREMAAHCTIHGKSMYLANSSYGRLPLKDLPPAGVKQVKADSQYGPPSLQRAVGEWPDGTKREALVGTDGFFSFGPRDFVTGASPHLTQAIRTNARMELVKVRGYDAQGNRVMDRDVGVGRH